MRRLILFSFVAVGLFLAGCSDQSSLVGPTQQISQQQGRTLIDLPVTSLNKSIKASEKIDGAQGGIITLEGSLKGDIKVSASLVIPADAFEGTLNRSVSLDDKTASFKFGPSGTTFAKPLTFNATISGLNLSGSSADFVYVENKGGLSAITNDASGISDGNLYVVNAQLGHFSRYGWAK